MSTPSSKKRIAIQAKTKARLQQEIGSECPFCDDNEVAHFDYHHIDEDPSNSAFENLLMCCKPCHSKITKGEISKEAVVAKKKSLPFAKIELASIAIDSNNCSWLPYDDVSNAFYNSQADKSPFPILTFSLINHYKKTVVLTAIHLQATALPSGLSGLPQPQVLRSSVKYRLPVSYEPEGILHPLLDQLEIPPERAFQFQVELYIKYIEEFLAIEGRDMLRFTFYFGVQTTPVKAPPIFMNCRKENEQMILYYLE
jgi:hypothetical protein